MSRFDPRVLTPDPVRRGRVLEWLGAGLAAVDPERLTREALAGRDQGATVVVAIGKAAPAMTRGAAASLDLAGGVCVTDHAEPVPPGVELLIGDHPVPGPASVAAGKRVLDFVAGLPPSQPVVALISGGGSALCEMPAAGIDLELLVEINRRLISGGASIDQLNLVRSHLSALKGGGLSRAAGRPIETLVLSDVGAAGPEVIASGPTVPGQRDPSRVLGLLAELSIDLPRSAIEAIEAPVVELPEPEVTRLGDGRVAAQAIARRVGGLAAVADGWLDGPVQDCLDRFLAESGPGVTIGAGEVTVDVQGSGSGGRNTHAALLAAGRLAGTGDIFCAFATDGVDGASGAAGAIVDGGTLTRGGDPVPYVSRFDSATYLERSSDLLVCPPTGTNVSDLWILWREAEASDLE